MAFDSQFEKAYSEKNNIPKNVSLKLPYTIDYTYTPDFVDHDEKIIFETKGFFPPEERRKMIAVKKANPDWHIIMVFQNPNAKINKKSKTTYSQWAIKNGFEVR